MTVFDGLANDLEACASRGSEYSELHDLLLLIAGYAGYAWSTDTIGGWLTGGGRTGGRRSFRILDVRGGERTREVSLCFFEPGSKLRFAQA
jgi:hypothetical protein